MLLAQLQPPDFNIFWYLPPLVVAISLVYSGTRFESPKYIFLYAIRWPIYILTFLGATWILLYLLGTGEFWAGPLALVLLFIFLFGGSFRRKHAPKDSSIVKTAP